MVDQQRRRLLARRARSPTAAPARRRSRTADRSREQIAHRRLQARVGLEDHAVLVRLREDGRDDALAEGVVERVVDRRRRDAEARRRCRGRCRCRPAGPASCRSLATSASCGHRVAACRRSFGTQVASSAGSASSSDELVLRAADRSCRWSGPAPAAGRARCPATLASSRLQPADDRRWRRRCARPCGLRLIRMRPLLSVVLVPSTPMKEDRLATSGSLRIASASACWRSRHRGERDRSAAPRRCPGSARCPGPGRSPWG